MEKSTVEKSDSENENWYLAVVFKTLGGSIAMHQQFTNVLDQENAISVVEKTKPSHPSQCVCTVVHLARRLIVNSTQPSNPRNHRRSPNPHRPPLTYPTPHQHQPIIPPSGLTQFTARMTRHRHHHRHIAQNPVPLQG
jgi:hypothetical protein